ncbi:MAG: hypothetical protein AAF570_08795, partial [Bacteroidota bacterium]
LDLPFTLNRPELTCSNDAGQIILQADTAYGDYRWSTYESTSSITVTDTGKYQVFVRQGEGWIGSKVLHITDLNDPCSALTDTPEPQVAPTRPPKLIGVYDITGRQVSIRQAGVLYIERYDNGQSRKVIHW